MIYQECIKEKNKSDTKLHKLNSSIVQVQKTVTQPFTKYFRLTLVPCEISHYGKILITVYLKFFAIIDKIFYLAGRLGTRISFYGV